MPTEKDTDGIAELVRTLSEEYKAYLQKIIREEIKAELDRREARDIKSHPGSPLTNYY